MVISGHRKVVTVLFCDLVGSTALGESVDPEALQGLLARYFERMKAIVELHGGSVEKFIGDAVMAVFGVPVAHEDDALRACRAAVEMRDALPELRVAGRIGVNTGEVLAGTEERLATGDAVNVAARLEQAAEPGEVLIGSETLGLVGAAVEVGEERLLPLKGKNDSVAAHPLVAVLEVPERSHGSRFVGRERELQQLVDAWDRALAGPSCEFVTVVGDPGVGKSRLVAEALAGLEARVLRGRCLPYGKGITYWPVVEVVRQLGVLPSDPVAAAAIRSLLGESETGTSGDEIAWAFRKLLEEQAPLCVVFDDIQWGDETFLDLIESIGPLSAGAPLLLLCMARPELVGRRPTWPATLQLEPLPPEQADALIGATVAAELRERIVHAAGGNPLFISEMLEMAGDNDDVEVPPTLKALLAARLDQLDTSERRVLERGSVEGEIFHRGSVQALAPEETQLTTRLAALVRHQLVQPDRAQLVGDDAYRFRHLLIRDAAYDALPKATRAVLHERFAAWLEERGDLIELDEILGYHLEQAARYKDELGEPDPGLAVRAGERLAVAGRRAYWRGDFAAAAQILERSVGLLRAGPLDVALELDLAFAKSRESPRFGIRLASATVERAQNEGDSTGEALAKVALAFHRYKADGTGVEEWQRLADQALPQLEQVDNHPGLVHVWASLSELENIRGTHEGRAHGAEQALLHARLAGAQPSHVFGLDTALVYGPRPTSEALEALDRVLPEFPHPRPLFLRAVLLAMLGRFEEARALARDASERIRVLGELSGEENNAEIARLAGDLAGCERHLRVYCDWLEERGRSSALREYAGRHALALAQLGRYADAESRLQDASQLAASTATFGGSSLQAMALVQSNRGTHEEAEAFARDAVAVADPTDEPFYQGDALSNLAQVLAAAGRTEEATEALERALDCYERKQVIPLARRIREQLARD